MARFRVRVDILDREGIQDDQAAKLDNIDETYEHVALVGVASEGENQCRVRGLGFGDDRYLAKAIAVDEGMSRLARMALGKRFKMWSLGRLPVGGEDG